MLDRLCLERLQHIREQLAAVAHGDRDRDGQGRTSSTQSACLPQSVLQFDERNGPQALRRLQLQAHSADRRRCRPGPFPRSKVAMPAVGVDANAVPARAQAQRGRLQPLVRGVGPGHPADGAPVDLNVGLAREVALHPDRVATA